MPQSRVRGRGGYVMLAAARSPNPGSSISPSVVPMRACLTLLALVAVSTVVACAVRPSGTTVRSGQQVAADPCAQRKASDFCIPELPTAAPVVAGEGRIWGLFGQRDKFEIREYSAAADGVLARGACPEGLVASVLGVVDTQPAIVCADFERGRVVFGRKLPNGPDFGWQAAEVLAREPEESVKAISHFALLDRRLVVVYRTEAKSPLSGLISTQWRLQIASGPAQLTRQAQSNKPLPPPQAEILCPRPGVTRCDQPPVAAYVADREMHVVLASGISADRYLHLTQAPGKDSKTVPVPDVTLTGKSIKGPCVATTTNGNLKVYVPSRSLVSSLLSDQGERVGVIAHQGAAIAQGPDVHANADEKCLPEISALLALPNAALSAEEAKPQWLRATQSKDDKWIVGYGVPSYAVKQGDVTYSYKESFWVVRR